MMTHKIMRGISRSALIAVLALGAATTAHADATAECNTGPNIGSTECGVLAVAQAAGSLAVGSLATVSAESSGGTAVGFDSVVRGQGGVALGGSSIVGLNGLAGEVFDLKGAMAIGNYAISTTVGGARFARPADALLGSISMGYYSRAVGGNNIAIGGGALVGDTNSDRAYVNSTAIGTFARVSANDAIALGQGATVTVNRGLAIGSGVRVNGMGTALINSDGSNSVFATGLNSAFVADNSVAIGAGSVTEQANSIAIGRSAYVNSGNGFGAIPQRVPEVGPAGSIVLGSNSTSNGDNNLVLGNYANVSGRFDAANNLLPAVSYATAVGTGATVEANRGTALGHSAVVTAPNSVAIGADSVANEANTVSFGALGNQRRLTNIAAGINDGDAVNMGQFNALSAAVYGSAIAAQQQINNALARTAYLEVNSGEGAAPPRATGRNAIGLGAGANASGDSSIAMGVGAVAENGAAVAIGLGNRASGNGAVAIGDPNVAVGDGAVAIGKDNTATGNGAVALGNASTATGNGGVAIGNQANAGTSSIAIGNNANAAPANSVAIGNGAVARSANEVALGNGDSTYTFAGLAAAGEGPPPPPRFLSVDAQGRVSRSAVGPSDIVNLQGQLATLAAQTTGISNRVDTLTGRVGVLETRTTALEEHAREANGGIAAAMAIGNAFLPEGQSIAVSFNLSTYRGEQGFSGAVVARVSDRIWVSGGVAGSTVGGSTGGRAGVTFGW